MKKIMCFIFILLSGITLSSCEDNSSNKSTKDNSSAEIWNGGQTIPKSRNTEPTVQPSVDKPIKSISLSSTSTSLNVGNSTTLFVNYNPVDADNRSVTWYSSEPSIASVMADGTVKALAKGNAIITATTLNGQKATCQVTVCGTFAGINSTNYMNYFDVDLQMLSEDSLGNVPFVASIYIKDDYEITSTFVIKWSITVYYTYYRITTGRSIKCSGEKNVTITAQLSVGKRYEVSTSYIEIGSYNSLKVNSYKTQSITVTGSIEKVR